MTQDGPLAVFVASDGDLEAALPFLEAFRQVEPRLRLLMIPRDAAFVELAGFRASYDFTILDRDFTAIDLLGRICFGDDPNAAGRLRRLAAFDIAAPAVACLDLATRVDGLGGLLGRLAAATRSTVAVEAGSPATVYATGCDLPAALAAETPFSTALLGIGGPAIGSARLIRALRENLVAYMTCRAPGAQEAAVLNVAISALGISRVGLHDVAVRTRAVSRSVLAVEPLSRCGGDLTMLDNGGSYRRRPGRIVGSPDWLASAYDQQARRELVEPPPAMVARLRHATVHARGIVVTRAGDVVRESLINIDAASAEAMAAEPSHWRPVACRDVAGPLVVLKQTWDNNYAHWLVESLPRVGLVAECMELSACRFLVAADGGAISQVFRDSLRLLGIAEQRIVASGDETRFCAELIYPAPLTVQPWVKAPRVVRFLEALGDLVPPGETGARRLYVGRNPNSRRALLNEAEILAGVTARGYVAVVPGMLEFEAQVRMFRNATHVVGNLGAALVNVAFAPRGVRLLALTTQFMQDDFFWDLVSQRGGHYVSLHGAAVDPAAGMQSDFEIDADVLWRLLDGFEGDDPTGAGQG